MRTKSKAAAYFDVPAMNQQAIASQFKEFKTEVADAIRAKKGTTESINPQDFAEEIASIETGGGGNYVYYRASGEEMGVCVAFSSVVKAVFNGDVVFVSFVDVMYSNMNALEWGFDTNLKFTNPENKTMTTVGDYIAEASKNWTQITEEEFYKIPRLFTYRDKTYEYEEGQTWGEWVNSSYNTIGAYVGVPEGLSEEHIMRDSNLIILEQNTGIWVKPSDLIQSIVYSYGGAMPA